MTASPLFSRRRALAFLGGLPLFAGAAGRAVAGPDDRGIGGTGASISPAEPEGDRGIGGTGVIGTIRRFGSIVVNDLRIAYPANATVRIDDAEADPRALKIGQVVRVVAVDRGGQLSTQAIAVTSEAVGPVERSRGQSLTVLGQSVSVARLPKGQRRWAVGDTVAVSGLRRPDGVIVASLIERREPGREQVVGPVTIGADGAPMVGGLKLDKIDPPLIGERALLRGRLEDGSFAVKSAKSESLLLDRGVTRLSIEAYVERQPDGLRLGSGLPVSGSNAALPLNRTVRAVLETLPVSGGGWRLDSVRLDGAGPAGGGQGGRGGQGGPASRGPNGQPIGAPVGPAGRPHSSPLGVPSGAPRGGSIPHGGAFGPPGQTGGSPLPATPGGGFAPGPGFEAPGFAPVGPGALPGGGPGFSPGGFGGFRR